MFLTTISVHLGPGWVGVGLQPRFPQEPCRRFGTGQDWCAACSKGRGCEGHRPP